MATAYLVYRKDDGSDERRVPVDVPPTIPVLWAAVVGAIVGGGTGAILAGGVALAMDALAARSLLDEVAGPQVNLYVTDGYSLVGLIRPSGDFVPAW